jgi:ribosomal protein L40E
VTTDASVYCIHCGAKIPNDAGFCTTCGRSQVRPPDAPEPTSSALDAPAIIPPAVEPGAANSGPRRSYSPLLILLPIVAVAVVAAWVLFLQPGSASAPALTDPKEIVTAAVRTAQTAKSVHVDATLDGSINADLSGTGAPGAAIALTGTTAAADVDLTAGNAHATFAVPALLGLSGELIQIGGTSYVKTTLTGDKYQTQKTADSLPLNPSDSKSLVDSVGELLSKPGMDPVKGDDVACGSTQCYTVKIELNPAELNALGAGGVAPSALPIDLGSASLNLTVRVEKDSNRLAGLAASVSMGDQGSLTFDLTFSKWDQAVSVSAPPADQVQPGS